MNFELFGEIALKLQKESTVKYEIVSSNFGRFFSRDLKNELGHLFFEIVHQLEKTLLILFSTIFYMLSLFIRKK